MKTFKINLPKKEIVTLFRYQKPGTAIASQLSYSTDPTATCTLTTTTTHFS